MSEQQKPTGWSAIGTMLFDVSVKVGELFLKIFYLGVKNAPWGCGEFYILMALAGVMIGAEVFDHEYLYLVIWFVPRWSWHFFVPQLVVVNWWYIFTGLYMYFWVLVFLAFGIKPFVRMKKFQRAIDCLALKNGLGVSPKVLWVWDDGPYRTKIKLRSEGVGTDRYESREMTFNRQQVP